MFHISCFCLVVSHCEHLCTSVFPSLQESLYPHPQIHHDISYPWRNLQCYDEILVLVVVRLQSERMFRDYSFVQFREYLPHNLELPCAESTVNAKNLTVIGKRFHCFGKHLLNFFCNSNHRPDSLLASRQYQYCSEILNLNGFLKKM